MKKYIIIFWSALVVFALVYGFFSLKAPATKLKQWYRTTAESLEVENKRVANDEALKDLTHEKIFLQNRLQMSKSDSINLIVDLRDSVVAIELKGVRLHSAKIKSYKLPSFFKAIDINTLNRIFSEPLIVAEQESNVPKMPITIKKAPKTPEEASTQVEIPDTALNIPVFVKLNIDSLFHISFKPVFTNQDNYHSTMRKVQGRNAWQNFVGNWGSIVKGQIPEYTPHVEIYMLSPDIVGIYRALPSKPQMAFMWP